MTRLHEDQLPTVYRQFLQAVAAAIGLDTEQVPMMSLVIDDRQIEDKKAITSTNGRYFFRNQEAYKQFYIPHADSPGVYFFIDKDGIVVYVGKSETTGGLGRRVASHIGRFEDGTFPNLAFDSAQHVIVIPFKTAAWLAPGFESYLLSRYKFKYNFSLAERERAVLTDPDGYKVELVKA